MEALKEHIILYVTRIWHFIYVWENTARRFSLYNKPSEYITRWLWNNLWKPWRNILYCSWQRFDIFYTSEKNTSRRFSLYNKPSEYITRWLWNNLWKLWRNILYCYFDIAICFIDLFRQVPTHRGDEGRKWLMIPKRQSEAAKGKTTIYKTLHWKQTIDQHEPRVKPGLNSCASERLPVPAPLVTPVVLL
jgi:hypothetical protein